MARSLRFVRASELRHLPSVKFLADTHLVANGLNVLFGPSGCFKSFYMLHQALSIAKTLPVVYVAAEGVSGLAIRVAAWCEYWQCVPEHLYFVCEEINLLDSEAVGKFAEKIHAEVPNVALVIFDTYARCLVGGDENSAKDAGKAIYHCAAIQRRFKCAIALVHHTNRREQGERGSGAMRGAADLMIEMSSNGDHAIKVDCSKLKDGEPWETELYVFKSEKDSGILIPAVLSTDDKLTKRQIEILDFLALEIFVDNGAKGAQLIGGLNISPSTLYRALSDLKKHDFIRQDRLGDPYFITADGQGIRVRSCQTLSAESEVGKLSNEEDSENDSHDSQSIIN